MTATLYYFGSMLAIDDVSQAHHNHKIDSIRDRKAELVEIISIEVVEEYEGDIPSTLYLDTSLTSARDPMLVYQAVNIRENQSSRFVGLSTPECSLSSKVGPKIYAKHTLLLANDSRIDYGSNKHEKLSITSVSVHPSRSCKNDLYKRRCEV